jgi:succinate-acetate transporter protein
MSTISERGAQGTPVQQADGVRVSSFLQPIAAPTVLGYYAAASGFLLFGVWFAGALGGVTGATAIFPFLLLFAGIGQLAAGIWSIRARDASSMSLFAIWGGFWIGYGVLWLLDVTGTIALPAFTIGFGALGQVFIYMAVITWTTAFAALARSPFRFLTHATAGTAATIACVSLIAGAPAWQAIAGWLFVATAGLCLYDATASMFNALFGVVVLPHFSWRRDQNLLGRHPVEPFEFEDSEPGLKAGH